MRKIREILRLRYECSQELRAIALSVGGSPATVHGYLKRAAKAGLEEWAAVESLSESELRQRLFVKDVQRPSCQERVPFDCGYVHTELHRVGVTLLELWREYVEAAKSDTRKPYGYSQFCDRYKLHKKSLRRSMRQVHRAGERAFVDYSGKRPTIVHPDTGQEREVELFVMTLGASHYTYAEATLTQTLPDFCASLIRGLEFFGGAPEVLVPDQLRSAVRGPDRYDPDINRTCHDLAVHYGMTVLPARPRKPKDKAKVEVAVQIVQRWVLARIRNETFTNLAALNARIRELVRVLNETPFQKRDGSRKSLFDQLDKPALKPLPQQRFEVALRRLARVHVDYHVSLFDRHYSVPSQHVGAQVDIRYTQTLVEVYLDGIRIASHLRCYGPRGQTTTDPAHMPKAHRELGTWTQQRLLECAQTHGPCVFEALHKLMQSYPRAEFGLRAALGIIRLADRFGSAALNEACARALLISTLPPRRRLLLALLRAPARLPAPSRDSRTLGTHEHVRGPDYFHLN